jgi:hypothetical protein
MDIAMAEMVTETNLDKEEMDMGDVLEMDKEEVDITVKEDVETDKVRVTTGKEDMDPDMEEMEAPDRQEADKSLSQMSPTIHNDSRGPPSLIRR